MIDFGLSTKYQDENINHLPKQKSTFFKGNLVFGSRNAFRGISLSRRDDLISLADLLLYLIVGDLEYMKDGENEQQSQDQASEFQKIGLKKVTMTPEELCISNESKKIYPFLKEVYGLKYDEEPNYNKLNFILVKELMSENLSPSKEFDWMSNN